MRILLLGDVCGPAGMKIIKLKLRKIIKEKKIDFTIANGENAAENGKGITKNNFEELVESGVDVITSGNHIWDQKEILEVIENEKNLIRPANLLEGQPGNGYGIYEIKNKKIAVINLIGNVFMKKSQDLFSYTEKIIKKIKLKKDADFIIIDIHGETTSEKMALGYFLDGKVTTVVGTSTISGKKLFCVSIGSGIPNLFTNNTSFSLHSVNFNKLPSFIFGKRNFVLDNFRLFVILRTSIS